MEVEINGKKYQRIEKKPMSKSVSKMLMMVSMFAGISGLSGYTKKRPTVILEQEYGLIEKKKSKLSRNDRDWVIYQFESQYKLIS